MNAETVPSTNYSLHLQEKIARHSQELAPYLQYCNPRVIRSPKTHYRNRTEFRIWHEGNECYFAMTNPQNKQLERTDQFHLANESINDLMLSLHNILNYIEILRHKLFSIEFLTNSVGDAVITLIYHQRLDSHWEQVAKELASQLSTNRTVNIVGRSRKQKMVVGADWIEASFIVGGKAMHYCHVEGSFTQPNGHINQEMLGWVYEVTNSESAKPHDHDALELYCGNGNFTLALACNYRQVLATEISKSGINALNWALQKNSIDNVKCVRLSAEEASSALDKEREFRRLQQQSIEIDDYDFTTVLVDPPRAGLDDKTLEFISRFQRIIYVSCNPETFTDNMSALNKSHQIKDFRWFDQFPLTPHIEIGALIERRLD